MKEEEIRPEKLFSEFILLADADAKAFFGNAPFYMIPCPACKNPASIFQFRKSGFNFEECPVCGTLYANPRAPPEFFSRYYSEAPSIKFWATHFYKTTEESRRHLIIRPKAMLVKSIIEKYAPQTSKNSCILDIGAGYGVFCQELQNLFGKDQKIIAIEPTQDLQQVCREKGIWTIGKFFEDVSATDLEGRGITAATSFELLEHLADPDHFLKDCKVLLPHGAVLILTTLNWNGFDLQLLRERSRSIQPPSHINFFTVKSICTLLKRHGFTILEVTTPGKLDVDIVSKQLSDVESNYFKKLIEESDDGTKQKLQAFLKDAKLSSHMMVVAKKQ